jgi:hypothetical protein
MAGARGGRLLGAAQKNIVRCNRGLQVSHVEAGFVARSKGDNMSRFAIAIAAAAFLPLAAFAGEKPAHSEYMAAVSTYKPIQGFTHTVGSRHFVGYFLAANDACAVTVIDAAVGDEHLLDGTRRHKFILPAGDRKEIVAGHGKALGVGCDAEAAHISVVALERGAVESASR